MLATVIKELHITTEIQPAPIKCYDRKGSSESQQGQDIINAVDQVLCTIK